MADRITLNFGANTTDVEQGTDRIADSLDDVDRKLDDVGRAGEDAGDAAAGGLDDVGSSAGDVGGKLGDLGNIATDVLEGDIAGGARSAVSVLSGFADLIPGIGAAVGAGLALAANAFIGSWEKAAKANEDRIKTMYEDMIKSGNDFASQNFINTSISEILNDDARLAEVKNDAATAGVRLSLALRAEAGDQTALASILNQVQQRREELNAQQDAYIAQNGELSAAIDEQIGGLDVLETALSSYSTSADTAAANAALYREATEGAGTAVGNLTDKLNQVPDSIFAGITVDTASAEAEIDKFIARAGRRRVVIPLHAVDYGRTLD